MSIRALALELYRAKQRVDNLEKSYKDRSASEQDALQFELNIALKEVQMLRKMLDGEKESGDFRQRFKNFSK